MPAAVQMHLQAGTKNSRKNRKILHDVQKGKQWEESLENREHFFDPR